MKKIVLVLFAFYLFGFSQYPSNKITSQSEDEYITTRQRYNMVENQIVSRGVSDSRVLEAMKKIPRHLFVDESIRSKAYNDHPLPIGEGQTISQPYIVGMMTEALNLKSSDKVLEIGTGSGYQAAVLAEIVQEVYSIEIRERLVESSTKLLRILRYRNITIKYGDGYYGWEDHAPFDAIIITASANHIPPPLIKQLKEGGRLIIPLGSTLYYQVLTLLTKEDGKVNARQMGGVAFVPMVGEVRTGE